MADDVRDAESALLGVVASAPQGTIIRVDFSEVSIASEAVRGLLRRPLRRIHGGEQAEAPERYIVLENVGRNWHSLEVTLRYEDLVSIAYRAASSEPELAGKADPAMAETYEFVRSVPDATAKLVMVRFGLNTIAAASNRLASLLKSALVRRVEERPTGAGGRQYVYTAVE